MLRTLCTAAAITLAAGFSGTALAQDGAHPHWSYGGHTGPSHWGTLEKEYAACASGHAQSPIDIHSAGAKKTDLPEIQFAYKSSPLTIVDNGHTVQVNYAPGSFISVGGKQYELVQFHFHKPSEERINGKPYDMRGLCSASISPAASICESVFCGPMFLTRMRSGRSSLSFSSRPGSSMPPV